MTDLAAQTCEACRTDAPQVTAEERRTFHAQVPEWDIIDRDGVPQLQRTFNFPDFTEAISFTDRLPRSASRTTFAFSSLLNLRRLRAMLHAPLRTGDLTPP